jgi:3-hydroxyisobutyrate dehydrogenase-like beta-hydroxyacid dehydrogenase
VGSASMEDPEVKVGFAGLGNMGSAMARDLIKAGHSLMIYNRTHARAEEFRALGAKGCRFTDRSGLRR